MRLINSGVFYPCVWSNENVLVRKFILKHESVSPHCHRLQGSQVTSEEFVRGLPLRATAVVRVQHCHPVEIYLHRETETPTC